MILKSPVCPIIYLELVGGVKKQIHEFPKDINEKKKKQLRPSMGQIDLF